jgi:phosphotransferase system enzyme I (PtsI)
VKTLTGVAASSGTGIAPALVHRPRELTLPDGPVQDAGSETTLLEDALGAVAAELDQKAFAAGGELAEILSAQAAMARDPELLGTATTDIQSNRSPAARAIVAACESFAESFARSESEYMAARAEDIRFIGAEVARHLLGQEAPNLRGIERDVVIVAAEVPPADVADLDPALVKAIATEQGSRTSHTAIVARSLGVPAVVAVSGLLEAVDGDVAIAVDGDAGEVHVDPDAGIRTHFEEAATRRDERRRDLLARVRKGPTTTADGYRIELAANIGSIAELRAALDSGAEGVGLLRTELLYLERDAPPTRGEQHDVLSQMLELLGDRRLVVRTFDFGADKPIPFLNLDPGPNPALDVRGLRLAREHEGLLDDQLRAIVEDASRGRVAVMAPMVATVEEAEWFVARVERAGGRDAGVEIGVMVEIPSAVMVADRLAARLDFLSIGTNDLTQYLHAADRQVGTLSYLQDAFSPALLSAVAHVCDAAADRAWVGVCGEAAGDPAWALLAVGLGVTELSMGPAGLLEVKVAINEHDLGDCRAAAADAASATTAAQARAIARELLAR